MIQAILNGREKIYAQVTLGDLMFSPNYAYHNEKRYLIPLEWWTKWCEYTNFDQYVTYYEWINKS